MFFLWMLSLLKSPFFLFPTFFLCHTIHCKEIINRLATRKKQGHFHQKEIDNHSMRLWDKVFPFFIYGCFQNCPAASLTGLFFYKHGASIFKWEELGVQWSEKATINRTSGTGSSCSRTGSKIHVAVCSSGALLCTGNNLKLTSGHYWWLIWVNLVTWQGQRAPLRCLGLVLLE